MTRFLLLGISFLFCGCDSKRIRIDSRTTTFIKGHAPLVLDYFVSKDCGQAPSEVTDLAVLGSFVGDHRLAIKLGDVAIGVLDSDVRSNIGQENLQIIRDKVQQAIALNTDSREIVQLKKLVEVLDRPGDLGDLFKSYNPQPAIGYIVSRATAVDFVLINEAHYCSQHRAFTASLLKPLWNKGYRYLALEALGYLDTLLSTRKHPIMVTGYYTRDSAFGNLIREALEIGYILVSYEMQESKLGLRENSSATLRDSVQAQNIFLQTKGIDKSAKVLVHAGYSHISELADANYRPMGSELARISGVDVFTIDQVAMTEHGDTLRENNFYRYVNSNFISREPVCFVDSVGNSLVDNVNYFAVDAQIYHPRTMFILGRPDWLVSPGKSLYKLPDEFASLDGYGIRVFLPSDSRDAVPIDQFIIGVGNGFVLKPGRYRVELVSRSGDLVEEAMISTEQLE